jgi:phosphopentomutase
LLDALATAGVQRSGVGKIDDLFAGRSITSTHTASNAEGIRRIKDWLSGGEELPIGEKEQSGTGYRVPGTAVPPSAGAFLFANLVDFDQLFGHRNDVAGFYGALREFDAALPSITSRLKEEDLLFITADHGNDPTTPSSDHAREYVPLLAGGMRVVPRDLGERDTFSDLGATVADWFGLSFRGRGKSFLTELIA